MAAQPSPSRPKFLPGSWSRYPQHVRWKETGSFITLGIVILWVSGLEVLWAVAVASLLAFICEFGNALVRWRTNEHSRAMAQILAQREQEADAAMGVPVMPPPPRPPASHRARAPRATSTLAQIATSTVAQSTQFLEDAFNHIRGRYGVTVDIEWEIRTRVYRVVVREANARLTRRHWTADFTVQPGPDSTPEQIVNAMRREVVVRLNNRNATAGLRQVENNAIVLGRLPTPEEAAAHMAEIEAMEGQAHRFSGGAGGVGQSPVKKAKPVPEYVPPKRKARAIEWADEESPAGQAIEAAKEIDHRRQKREARKARKRSQRAAGRAAMVGTNQQQVPRMEGNRSPSLVRNTPISEILQRIEEHRDLLGDDIQIALRSGQALPARQAHLVDRSVIEDPELSGRAAATLMRLSQAAQVSSEAMAELVAALDRNFPNGIEGPRDVTALERLADQQQGDSDDRW